MHLSGITLPPLGSIQDGVFRAVFLKQRIRELRHTTLMILAQGGNSEAVSDVFRDHSDDLLYIENVRKEEERSLREKYEEIRSDSPILSQRKDGTMQVTGIK